LAVVAIAAWVEPFRLSKKDKKRIYRVVVRTLRTTLQALIGTSTAGALGAVSLQTGITLQLAAVAGLAALVQNTVEELRRVEGIWNKELDDTAVS
jgi:hypothetical protein